MILGNTDVFIYVTGHGLLRLHFLLWVIVVDNEVPVTKGWKALWVFTGLSFHISGVWVFILYYIRYSPFCNKLIQYWVFHIISSSVLLMWHTSIYWLCSYSAHNRTGAAEHGHDGRSCGLIILQWFFVHTLSWLICGHAPSLKPASQIKCMLIINASLCMPIHTISILFSDLGFCMVSCWYIYIYIISYHIISFKVHHVPKHTRATLPHAALIK